MIRLSSRGTYAMLIMLELSSCTTRKYIPLKDIAAKYELSTKYLERVAIILSKGGLLDSVCGLDGGYRLNRPPSQYRVSEILLLAEGNRNERLLDFNILSGFNKLWQAAEDCHYSILEKKTLEDMLKEQNKYSI